MTAAASVHLIGNVGNRRPRKNRQQPWRRDPVILERLDIAAKVWAERHSERDCLAMINAHMAQRFPGEPPIRSATLRVDRARIRELWTEKAGDHREEHLAALDRVISEAYAAFRQASGNSLNRSAYLSVIANTIEKKARIDGSLVDRKQVRVEGEGAQVNVTVMDEGQLAEVVRLSMEHLPRLAGLVEGRRPEVIDVEGRVIEPGVSDSTADGALSVRNEGEQLEDGLVWTGDQ